MDKKLKRQRSFSDTEKHEIILEWKSSNSSKSCIWKKYTGEEYDHGQILYWMRSLGYLESKSGRVNIARKSLSKMKKKGKTKPEQEKESFETLQLRKRIAELEKQLKEAEIKAIAFSTMVDIAEEQFKIPIRKKYNTKP